MNSEIEKRILYSSGNRNNTASITTSNTTKTYLPEWAPAYTSLQISVICYTTRCLSLSDKLPFLSLSCAYWYFPLVQPTPPPVYKLETNIEIIVQVYGIVRDSTTAVLHSVKHLYRQHRHSALQCTATNATATNIALSFLN